MPYFIIVFDADYRVVFWNKEAEVISGISYVDNIDNDLDLMDRMFPDADYRHFAFEEIMNMKLGALPIDLIIKDSVGAERVYSFRLNSNNFQQMATLIIISGFDITDFKLMETQLLKEKIRAEEYDRAKSTFLANMSHEFRTPLNSILGFTKMLSESISNGEHDCDKALEYLGYIDKGGEKLLEIVNDLILMSRIEAGMFTIANSNIDIGQIVKDVVNKFSSEIKTAKESGIVFNIVFPKNAVVSQIFADKDALKIILQHILSNALKYTEKGLIQIGYKFTPDDGVEFFVSDTGKGISKEDCKNIFTSFYRVDVSKKREKGGIGLGLSISLKLARMMNSEIKYDSTPGKGSRFSLKLFFAGDRNV